MPTCLICSTEVNRVGEFCSPECWVHFHVAVMNDEQVVVLDYNYLDLEEQPWYGDMRVM